MNHIRTRAVRLVATIAAAGVALGGLTLVAPSPAQAAGLAGSQTGISIYDPSDPVRTACFNGKQHYQNAKKQLIQEQKAAAKLIKTAKTKKHKKTGKKFTSVTSQLKLVKASKKALAASKKAYKTWKTSMSCTSVAKGKRIMKAANKMYAATEKLGRATFKLNHSMIAKGFRPVPDLVVVGAGCYNGRADFTSFRISNGWTTATALAKVKTLKCQGGWFQAW